MAEFGFVYKGILTEGRNAANHSSQASLWHGCLVTICDGLCRYWSGGGNVTVWLQPRFKQTLARWTLQQVVGVSYLGAGGSAGYLCCAPPLPDTGPV